MWSIKKVINHFPSEVSINLTILQGDTLQMNQFPLLTGSRTASLNIPYTGTCFFEDIGNRPLGPSTQTWGVIISYLFRRWIFRYEGNGELEVTIYSDGALHFSSPNGGTIFPINTTDEFTIESVQFPGVFLRMDGDSIISFIGMGAGTVNCTWGAGPYEKFNIAPLPDGSYTIGSRQFPNVFLRLDGTGVSQPTGPGGGHVNLQWGHGNASAFEKFHLRDQGDGTYAIESFHFPGVFLRMDGNGISANHHPGGTVNCQFGAGAYEKFRISPAPPTN